MDANWEPVDDDLEMLLEFEDDLDRPTGRNVGRKQPPSNAMPISVSTAEPRSTSGNPNGTNTRNRHEQFQSELNQRTDDGGKSASKNNGNDETNPRTSSYTIRGKHDTLVSLRNREHDCSSSRHKKISQVADVNYINEEDLVSSIQVFSRVYPHGKHNVEERNVEDREQGVRLLSGLERDRKTETGGCSEISRGSRERTSKRSRYQGRNAGNGWDDPVIVDDFANQEMDCTEGGFPDNGRHVPAFSLLSSPEEPPVLKAAEDKQKEFFIPVTVLGYKIPGPAGAWQSCVKSTGPKIRGFGLIDRHFGPGRQPLRPAATPDTLDFREGPWLAAMDFLKDGKDSSRSTIVTIKATTGHIPQLVAIINTIVPNKFGDLAVTLKDPTGIVGATIHRNVLTELDDGHLIAAGAVIVIRKVAVFSPTRFSHYLNITRKNVDQIFGKDTDAPRRRRKTVNDRNDIEDSRRGNPISDPGLDGKSQMQIAAEDVYPSETIAPNVGISGRQEVTYPTGTLGKDAFIQMDCRKDKSPASDTGARNSLPLPITLGHAVDSRKRAATANVGVGDSRASQEAIAKAAGWDISEDPEWLLDDEIVF